MNLTLLPGLTPAGDAATDGLVPAADNDALSSAFAQLLGERFRPAGQRSGVPQPLAADAEPTPGDGALSQLLNVPEQFETLANLTARAPADAAVAQDDTSEPPTVSALKTHDAPDAATLQALLAMLPAIAAPQPDEQRAVPAPADNRPPGRPSAPAVSLIGALHDDAAPSAERVATPVTPRQTPAAQNSAADAAPQAIKTDLFTTDRVPLSTDSASSPAPQHAMTPAPQFTASQQPAAAVAAPAAPLLNAPLGSPEWQQALSQQVLMFHRGGQQSAELRLHPQELGSLQITLKLDDQQAQLHIASAHGQVRAAAEAAIPHLRHALAESGINLGQSSVGGDATPQQSQQQASQEHGRSPSYREQHSGADLPAEATAAPPTLQALARAVDGVDIFA
ncbi:flagellar hook-length control protein FliK [Serratia sp. MYb239]|uniref:flagellar hook-length control protein FliK n=1 Tax=Serratia sp. MYb239 TaxID=2033438 RepID=UPI0018F8A196|nr:flagellar hook-length control protein FliK [Serratia sp. MYb239]